MNLTNMTGITDASVSRDVDVAGELADLTRSAIRMQTGVAVLAQANTTRSGVLGLFR